MKPSRQSPYEKLLLRRNLAIADPHTKNSDRKRPRERVEIIVDLSRDERFGEPHLSVLLSTMDGQCDDEVFLEFGIGFLLQYFTCSTHRHLLHVDGDYKTTSSGTTALSSSAEWQGMDSSVRFRRGSSRVDRVGIGFQDFV